MAEYTPGPWRVRFTDASSDIVALDGQRIASTVSDHPMNADRANARLIAAAPRTRADLDALLAAAKAVCLSEGEELGQAWLSLREAIGQAEGGEV